MASPEPTDFLDVRSLLTEEERQVQDTVARFVDEKAIPVFPDAFDRHHFPKELIPEIAGMGLLGCNLSGYDCAGLNHVSYGLVCQELERADSGLRSFVSVQGSLCMFPIHAYGTEEQKQRWLPGMAAGEIIGCFGLTEPDGGSDPGVMKTRAVQDGGDWILNGAKMWITNGSQADVAVVWAQTGDIGDTKSIRGFVVPTDTPGFSARDQKGKLSLLASDTSELVLEDVALPEEALMLNSTGGLKCPLMCLTQARYGIAWGTVGAAMACFDEARSYAKERVMFDGPIGGKQIQQVRLADMFTQITLGQLLVYRLGRLKDEGTMTPFQVSMAKRNNVDMACNIAREARRLLGANGILVEYHSMRHMANLESVYTYEGTHDIHSLILGQTVTGIAAY